MHLPFYCLLTQEMTTKTFISFIISSEYILLLQGLVHGDKQMIIQIHEPHYRYTASHLYSYGARTRQPQGGKFFIKCKILNVRHTNHCSYKFKYPTGKILNTIYLGGGECFKKMLGGVNLFFVLPGPISVSCTLFLCIIMFIYL